MAARTGDFITSNQRQVIEGSQSQPWADSKRVALSALSAYLVLGMQGSADPLSHVCGKQETQTL